MRWCSARLVVGFWHGFTDVQCGLWATASAPTPHMKRSKRHEVKDSKYHVSSSQADPSYTVTTGRDGTIEDKSDSPL
jgi:hypothetical protein